MKSQKTAWGLMMAFMFSIASATAPKAAELVVQVNDSTGAPLPNTVINLTKIGTAPMSLSSDQAVMAQRNMEFIPHVLAVRRGASISFPNEDQFRHHVYSFSPAKTFELRLYGEDENKKVVFDKEGVVALGCNIHDNMLAYIYVTNAHIFGVTDEKGMLKLDVAEAGEYQLLPWHPRLRGKGNDLEQKISIKAANNTPLALTLSVRAERKSTKGGHY